MTDDIRQETEWSGDYFPPLESPAEALAALERQYALAKNGLVLMEALEICAEHQLPPPRWCGKALRKIRLRWNSGRARTFDEAIRIKRRKYWRRSKHQLDNKAKGLLYLAVRECHKRRGYALNSSQKDGKSAFVEVGKAFHTGAKEAEERYYAEKPTWDRIYQAIAERYPNPPENSPEYWRNYFDDHIEVDFSHWTFTFNDEAAAVTMRLASFSDD